jgi:hypothetical protein
MVEPVRPRLCPVMRTQTGLIDHAEDRDAEAIARDGPGWIRAAIRAARSKLRVAGSMPRTPLPQGHR